MSKAKLLLGFSLLLVSGMVVAANTGDKPSAPKVEAANKATLKMGASTKNKMEQKGAVVKTPSGLSYIDLKVGTGPSPIKGQRVTVHYVGTLKDGTKFDSSKDRGQPFQFIIGVGQVIRGWDEGVGTMKVGGIRQLIIPPALGYGASGAGNVIPPNAELHFDVELLSIQ